MFTVDRRDFGPDFTFGVATAAYQVEGNAGHGCGSSIWDSFASTPGNVRNGDTGAIAVDHYNRWPADLDLIKDAGFDAYRFSLAWPRLIPEGSGAVNQDGIDFYDRLIDGMLERGLKPFMTLYHWDLPSPLQDVGGWMNRDIAGRFADYAALCAEHYGDRVAAVATINEPWCVSFLSHFLGIHAPGYRDIRATARAMHHVLFAHGAAVAALRAGGVKNVGIVTNLEKTEPASDSAEDAEAAALYDGIYNGWFLGGLYKGQYPAHVVKYLEQHLPRGFEKDMPVVSAPLDWAGVNYYTRSLVAADPGALLPLRQLKGPLEKTEMGWEIYPQGLTDLLLRVVPRLHQGAALRHRERHGRNHRRRRPAARALLRRSPQGRAGGAGRRGGRARLFRLVAARQLRVGRGLFQALRHRRGGLCHPGAHPPRFLPQLPGHAAQFEVAAISAGAGVSAIRRSPCGIDAVPGAPLERRPKAL